MGNEKLKLSMGAGVDSRGRIEFGGIEFFLYFISYLHCDCGYTFFLTKRDIHTHDKMPLKEATREVQRMICAEGDRTAVTIYCFTITVLSLLISNLLFTCRDMGTSLGIQWLGLCFPMQRVQV